MILLAVIAAAHGIQGAVKLKTFTQDPKSVLTYKPLVDEKGRPYRLTLARVVSSTALIVTIEGIKDRTQAESLRGTKLYVERQQLPDLEEEAFYYSDLIGLPVQSLEGQDIGKVVAVDNFGAGDFLEITDLGGHLYTICFTKEAVPHIQLPKREEKGGIQVDCRFLLGAERFPGEKERDEGEEA